MPAYKEESMPTSPSKAKAQARLAKAQADYPVMLERAVAENQRVARIAMKRVAEDLVDMAKFKSETAKANTAAMKKRIGKLQPSDVHANTRVLKTLIDGLRKAH